MNVLIPNATSPKNIGDLAMLTVLVRLIRETTKNARITVHSFDHRLHTLRGVSFDQTFYSWAVFTNPSFRQRFLRLSLLLISLSLTRVGAKLLSHFGTPARLLADYRSADLIVFAGGGYLRSQKGLTQTLNLLMQLLPIAVAKMFSAPKIVAPISFGPFAYVWQERLAAYTLSGLELVTAREAYSYTKLQSYKIPQLILASDLALLIRKKPVHAGRSFTLGFTIRKWLRETQQIIFEDEFIKSLTQFAKVVKKINFQPLVQVDAAEYGDDDRERTQKMANFLKKEGLLVRPLKTNKNVTDAVNNYASLSLLLGMRMHSNILAATQGVPFVAIAYEHKTDGIARQLGVASYTVPYTLVSSQTLFRLLNKAYIYRYVLRERLLRKVATIQKREVYRWHKIFSTYLRSRVTHAVITSSVATRQSLSTVKKEIVSPAARTNKLIVS